MKTRKQKKWLSALIALACAGFSIFPACADDSSQVVGGFKNSATGSYSVAVGGMENTASGNYSTVSGGKGNSATGTFTSVYGGSGNTAQGTWAASFGGCGNNASGAFSATYGGHHNQSSSDSSTVLGGGYNTVTAIDSTISGGFSNTISGNGSSSMFGGAYNTINNTTWGVVVGGTENTIENGGWGSLIAGGSNNTIDKNGDDNTIIGGNGNTIHGTQSNIMILGGADNTATGSGSITLGGVNTTNKGMSAVIIGGHDAAVLGNYAIGIGGGSTSSLASDSVAMGNNSYTAAKNSISIGYAAATDEEGTISFGHTAGTYGHMGLDGSKTYESDYYNRLINIADGQHAHDAAALEQVPTLTAGDNITFSTSTDKTTGQTNYNINVAKDITVDSVTTDMLTAADGNVHIYKDGTTTVNADKANLTVNKKGIGAGIGTSLLSVTNDNASLTSGSSAIVASDGAISLTTGASTLTLTDHAAVFNGSVITHIADGEISETSVDAINGSQLYQTNQQVETNAVHISQNSAAITQLNHKVSNLDSRIHKIGAGAAALAALHPLDFDPDAKWDFAAGYGNYNGSHAVALGAYYRPNEDTMFSVGGSFGAGENMLNAGLSLKIGAGSSHVSTSKVKMAKEIKELRSIVSEQNEKIAQLTALVNKLVDKQSVTPVTSTLSADQFTVDVVETNDENEPTIERVRLPKSTSNE